MTSSDSAQEGSIGPGRPVPLDERLIGEAGAVTFVILDTGSGIVTVGIWSNQQPALSEFYKKGRDSLAGAPIEIVGDDFLKVTPKAPLKPDLVKVKDYGVVPVPGLAFINQSGTILVTLSERQPPKGFIFIGQASVSMSNVRNWKNSKEPVLIREATDTRI